MKWINSRRFVVCLFCLAIIAYTVVVGGECRVSIATALVPVLVAFMGATTLEKVGEEWGKRGLSQQGNGKKKEGEEDD